METPVPRKVPAEKASGVRVFVSYAWENEAFRDDVKRLAARLRDDGVDARLDAWHLEGLTIPEFMSHEVRHADKILILCSPEYRRKVHAMEDGELVTGVGWELMLVTSAIWSRSFPRGKVEVVLFRGKREEAIPDLFQAASTVDLSDPDHFETNYLELLRRLTGHRELAPPIGHFPAGIEPARIEPLRGKGSWDQVPYGYGLRVGGSGAKRAAENARDVQEPTNKHLRGLVPHALERPSNYAYKIKNFLDFYTGTAERPVPFGGREAELELLDAWLDEPSAPRCLLLTSPAGRGKSALLIAWAQKLLDSRAEEVIFCPLSIRFETNLPIVCFSVLAAELAAIHGERSIPSVVDTPAEVWRQMVIDLLGRPLPEGHRVTIILDGVDELTDSGTLHSVFPVQLPELMRVVVSARYLSGDIGAHGWLVRLGWENLPVPPRMMELTGLTAEGVVRLLHGMSFPSQKIPENTELATPLYRLTRGDPLLLQLYVRDLLNPAETNPSHMESFGKLKPGLKSYLDDYFQRWKLDQKTLRWGDSDPMTIDAVKLVFDVLSCALGPLRLDDVQRLLPPDVHLSSHEIAKALQYFDRLVVGDGRVQGYVFTHSNLAEFFYERLSSKERDVYEARFRDWANDTVQMLNDGSLQPGNAPTYLILYYGFHLKRAGGRVEDFFKLVSNGWRRASEALLKTYAGFLDDVDRAWEAVRKEDTKLVSSGSAVLLGQEVLCALCRASVTSLAGRIPANVLIGLLREGILNEDQVLAFAHQAPAARVRAEALAALSRHLDPVRREQALRACLGAARELAVATEEREDSNGAFKGRYSEAVPDLFRQVLPELPSSLIEEALEIAELIHNEWDREKAVTVLLDRLPMQVFAKILGMVRRMDNVESRAGVIAAMGPRLPDSLLAEAFAIVDDLPTLQSRAMALAGLFPRWPNGAEDELMSKIAGIRDLGLRASVVGHLAAWLPARLVEETLEMVGQEQDSFRRKEALRTLIPHLPHTLLPQAIKQVGKLDGYGCAELFPLLVSFLSDAHYDQALEAALDVGEPDYRATCLAALTPKLPERLMKSVLDALRNAPETEGFEREGIFFGPVGKSDALAAIAPSLPQELVEEAIIVARQSPGIRSLGALIALIPRLSDPVKQQETNTVLRLTRRVNPWWRWAVLAELSSIVPPADRDSLLLESLEVARTLGSSQVLAELAPQLPAPLRATVLQEAFAAAQVIGDAYFVMKSLGEVAVHLPMPNWEALMVEAEGIASAAERSRMLAWLLPHLAETQRSRALSKILEAVPAIQKYLHPHNTPTRILLLEEIAPYLDNSDILKQVLGLLPKMDEDGKQALSTLVKCLPSTSRDALVTFLCRIDEESDVSLAEGLLSLFKRKNDEDKQQRKISLLTNVGPSVPECLAASIIGVAFNLPSVAARISVLGRFVKDLTPRQTNELVLAVEALGSPGDQFYALVQLIPNVGAELRTKLVPRAIDLFRSVAKDLMKDSSTAYEALEQLTPYLSGDAPRQLLSIMSEYRGHMDVFADSVLAALAPKLPPDLVQEGIKVAEFGMPLVSMLCRLAELGEAKRALLLIREIPDRITHARALERVARYLPTGLIDEALEAAGRLESQDCDRTCAAILQRLVALGEVERAIEQAALIHGERFRADLLVSAFLATTEQKRDTIAEAVLSSLENAPKTDYYYEWSGIASVSRNDDWLADSLLRIAPYMPHSLLPRAVQIANDIDVASIRARAMDGLMACTASLSKSARYFIFDSSVRRPKRVTRERFLSILPCLLPVIRELGGPAAIARTHEAICEVKSWWP